jgi:hypothetical protein
LTGEEQALLGILACAHRLAVLEQVEREGGGGDVVGRVDQHGAVPAAAGGLEAHDLRLGGGQVLRASLVGWSARRCGSSRARRIAAGHLTPCLA